MQIDLQTFTQYAAQSYIADLARLRIEVFREFPYLYDGDMAYEEAYLQTFLDAPDSLLVIAFDGKKVVGASTGIPMIHETENLQMPWRQEGCEVDQIFYYGESVLQRSYRGRGIGVRFFEEREKWVRQLGGYQLVTFCRVVRPDNHPLRPKNDIPLDRFWQHRGFRPSEDLYCTMSWKDVDQLGETDKVLHFWYKKL